MSIERNGDDIVITPPPAVLNLREELPNIVSDLSREQLEELVRNLRAGRLGAFPIGADYGAELARLIEPTAPGLASRVRALSWTRDQARWFKRKLIEVAVAALLSQGVEAAVDVLLNHDPPPQTQQIIVIDDRDPTNVTIDTTTVINLPPPPAPPAGEGPPNG